MAKGDELLIVEGREADRVGMTKVFSDRGYVVTSTARGPDALALCEQKFFPVVVVDLDVDKASGGLKVLQGIRRRSAPSSLVLVSGRKCYEAVSEAHRVGVVDVVLKRPDQVDALTEAVDKAADRFHVSEGTGNEMASAFQTVMDQAFKIMFDMARRTYGEIEGGSLVAGAQPRVLVVEHDQNVLKALAAAVQEKPWKVTGEMNGGGALDKVGQQRFDLIVCRADLPDLPGSMVAKSVQAQHPESEAIIYTLPAGGQPGSYELLRMGQRERFDKITDLKSFMTVIESVLHEQALTAKERRVMKAFRTHHKEFFNRYAELKLRLDRLLK